MLFRNVFIEVCLVFLVQDSYSGNYGGKWRRDSSLYRPPSRSGTRLHTPREISLMIESVEEVSREVAARRVELDGISRKPRKPTESIIRPD